MSNPLRRFFKIFELRKVSKISQNKQISLFLFHCYYIKENPLMKDFQVSYYQPFEGLIPH